ncbi:hypothetical protein EKO27_g9764 [Xylaria grammica]|uniref:Receptor L-domain domain-containing protein n=1 Tax=Xylaria grammica TaxID=363999 RepID=A0A439CT37_9PEZI|nr:hypothetical protein EKO27_g9764 [Xylaria grammica]
MPFVSADSLELWITGAGSLANFTIRNSTYFSNLILSDVASSGWPLSPNFASMNISKAGSISLDSCLPLNGLESADSLIGEFTLTNAAFINTVDSGNSDDESGTSVEVTNGMLLQSSYVDYSLMGGAEIPVRRIGTIGADLNITSNGNVHIAYDGLTGVRGRLSITDNWNCTINFDKLSTVGNIFFTNNTNTMLPLFPNLTTAGDIHISGFADTSSGPNLFPALKLASGNVVIETLNEVFDCSELISQLNKGIIHSLECNGRNYNRDISPSGLGNATTATAPKPNLSLSKGAWAGIGVGVGVVVIGILGAFIWLIFHYRSRLRKLQREAVGVSDETPPTEEPQQPQALQVREQVLQVREVDGRGIFREKPDDPLVEMFTQPTELPTNLLMRPQSWTKSETGELGWVR